MSMTKYVLPAVIAVGGLMLCSTASYGKAEYTKQTKKACTFCHVDAKKTPKELTEAGKYFEKNKSLDGFKAAK